MFLIASAACALAQSLPQLVLARVLQGIGGGGLIASAQSVIADVVPMRQRGRYQGYISVVWAVASMLGPVIGGVLTEYLSWPWIFWINLPVGGLALVLVQRSLGALPLRGGTRRIDGLGAVLLLAGLVALLIPITRVGQGTPWSESANLAGWAAALVLLAAFVVQQKRHPNPIVPLGLLGHRSIVACCGLLFLCFFNFIALSVLVPLRLQLGAGYSAQRRRAASAADDARRAARRLRRRPLALQDRPRAAGAAPGRRAGAGRPRAGRAPRTDRAARDARAGAGRLRHGPADADGADHRAAVGCRPRSSAPRRR